MSGLARRDIFLIFLYAWREVLPPLPSHQRMEAYGERRTNTICNALIFLLPK